MEKYLLLIATAMLGVAANAQQLQNTSFDGDFVKCYPWEKGNKVTNAFGTQPEGWCVSNVPNALAGSLATQVEGKSGKAILLKNTSTLGNGIPAYMTLGTTWATAEVKQTFSTDTRNKDGGVFGGINFTYKPDALQIVYKRDGQEKADKTAFVAYLWKGTWTQADVPSNTDVGLAKWGTATMVNMTDRDVNILGREFTLGGTVSKSNGAELIASLTKTVSGNVTDWKTEVIPFDYASDATPEKLNIVISAAGYLDDSQAVSKGVSITVDDVKLLYYSELASASYNGTTIELNADEPELTAVENFDESKLVLASNGKGATFETSLDQNVLTVTVKGGDFAVNPSNKHVYNIKVNVLTGIHEIGENTIDTPAYNIAGQRVTNAKGLVIKGGKKYMVK